MLLLSFPENLMPDPDGYEPKTMTIGTNNVFEVDCGTFYMLFGLFVLEALTRKSVLHKKLIFLSDVCSFPSDENRGQQRH